MKKIFVLLAIALITTGCPPHCDDCGDPVKYQVTANIDLSTTVKGMLDGNSKDYYTKTSNDTVQLSYLIYDASGALVSETQKTLPNFFEKASFTTGLKKGNYTIITWACIIQNGIADWAPAKKDALNTLTLNAMQISPYAPVLGVSKTSLDVSKEQTIDIAVPTVGCFFTVLINYPTSTKAKTILCIGDHDNNSYEVGSENSFFNTASDDNWVWQFTPNTQYTGTYTCCFILPTNLTLFWGTFDANDNLINKGQVSFTATAGKHQIITVNTDTGTSTVKSPPAPSVLESNGNPQALEVGKMKAEPAKISSKIWNSLRNQ